MASRQCLVAPAFIRDGKLRLAHQDAFKGAIARMHNCRVVLRLEEHLDPLSAALRAYYWGLTIDLVSGATGYTDREAHLEMKELHMPMRFAAVRGNGRIDGLRVSDASITQLSNGEMWEYISNIHQWASGTIDTVIPDPDPRLTVAA